MNAAEKLLWLAVLLIVISGVGFLQGAAAVGYLGFTLTSLLVAFAIILLAVRP